MFVWEEERITCKTIDQQEIKFKIGKKGINKAIKTFNEQNINYCT